jgi:hypothetical protein
MTYAALATTTRWRTLAIAVWSPLVTLPTYAVGAIESPTIRLALLACLGLFTLAGAVGFLGFGRHFHDQFFASLKDRRADGQTEAVEGRP